jgi:L-Ala-D/L-Glu epimerase
MRLTVEPLRLAFRDPVATAYAMLEHREVLAVRLETRDGFTGVGEAAPLEPYDGVSIGEARLALEAYRPILEAGDDQPATELMSACRRAAPLPQALAAIDLALWDVAGKREGRPVAALLADDVADAVVVNATVGAAPPHQAAGRAAAAAAAGFRCVKVKVGLEEDLARVAAVREAGGADMAIRLDANGTWTVDQAHAALSELAPLGIELVEEPVSGIAALRTLHESAPVPIAMDETSQELGALGSGAADAVCLKISRCGGIAATLAAAVVARMAGTDVYIASTFDGPAGVAAGLHVAAALRPERACGLSTLGLFADFEDPFPAVEGRIAVPAGPGLGV